MTAPIDLESLRGILKDEQQGAQMEGPLTDEELASLYGHCCYPSGILDRVIAELTSRRARDAEVEALVAAAKRTTDAFCALGESTPFTRYADRCLHECEQSMVALDAARTAAHDAPDKCFCDRMYPDSNPNASCGDCPTRDYTPKPAPAPAADGAGELPPLPEPVSGSVSYRADGSVLADNRRYSADKMHTYASAAIAALRQPVPDAVREEVVGAIAKPATGWDVAGNYGDGKWRAFRLEKQQTYLGDPKSSEMEAIAETHRLAASFSQQESRNAD